MPEPSPSRPSIGSLAIIGIVVAVGAGAFAYTAGWLSPARLTPAKIVDSLVPPGGPSLGHRRNYAKGICFTGVFESNGNGAELSSAQVFARGEYPALGV
jgi:catalase